MTIMIEDLKAVKRIVCHENGPGSPCPDGMASAILLRDVLQDAEIVFASHQGDAMRNLAAHSGMLFCDVTPPRERCADFAAVGAIVLDHHEKQKDDVAIFGARGIYAGEPGVSGAMLALRHVWIPMKYEGGDIDRARVRASEYEHAQRFAMLAGVRDTWQKDSPDWKQACVQAEMLRFYPAREWIDYVNPLDPERIDERMRVGLVLLDKRAASARHLADEVYATMTDKGTRVAIIGSTETSDVAELVEADILAGFRYYYDVGLSRIMLSLSFRSRGGYDVGALAASLKGGGHRAAAGAKVEAENAIGPHAWIARTINEHESGVSRTWAEVQGFMATEAVKRIGGCGQVDKEQQRVCLLPRDHEPPHGWEMGT